MRSLDLTAGTVYAYRDRRGATVSPVIVLNASTQYDRFPANSRPGSRDTYIRTGTVISSEPHTTGYLALTVADGGTITDLNAAWMYGPTIGTGILTARIDPPVGTKIVMVTPGRIDQTWDDQMKAFTKA